MRFFFIFLFIPVFLSAQSLKPGLYINSKVELIDGNESKIKNFLKYRFLKDGTAQLGVEPLFYSLATTYTVADSSLTIGRVSYKIDKITNDSLIIHEYGLDSDPEKFKRYYFVNEAAVSYKQKPIYNDNLKDSVYLSTKYLFAQYNGTVFDLLNELENAKQPGFLKVSFIITKEGKLTDFKILENNNVIESLVKKTSKTITTKLKDWVPAQLSVNNVNVNMKMLIRFNYEIFKGTPITGVIIKYIEQGE